MMSVGKAAAEIITEVRRQFREIKNDHGKTLKDAILWATTHEGEEMPEELRVKPDSNKCVEISTRSSVREMLAPGVYALLTPLTIGFMIGPKCLMGVLAGSIGCGAMIGIMMSNAGGAWDNAKKMAEKEGIKKTEQGKACVVGDTVGDPFKDTSGPALNILLKLIAMASVTIAPLLRDKDDWEDWYFGLIPLGLMLIATVILSKMGILTWADPLSKIEAAPAKQPEEVNKA
jgi:inorganic pyrophosphatase